MLTEERIKYLEKQGYRIVGNHSAIKTCHYCKAAIKAKHVALSLTGDACLYPKLPELIEEIHKKEMTSFVVTNGTITHMVKKLINQQPTQLYITLPAPDKETYLKMCNPIGGNYGWENIIESLYLLENFKRTAVRLTLVKNMNMFNPESYAKILEDKGFKFLELKSAMPIGDAIYRMDYSEMPSHEEIKKFAEKICQINNWKLVDEKPESKVVLIMKENTDERFLKEEILET